MSQCVKWLLRRNVKLSQVSVIQGVRKKWPQEYFFWDTLLLYIEKLSMKSFNFSPSSNWTCVPSPSSGQHRRWVQCESPLRSTCSDIRRWPGTWHSCTWLWHQWECGQHWRGVWGVASAEVWAPEEESQEDQPWDCLWEDSQGDMCSQWMYCSTS